LNRTDTCVDREIFRRSNVAVALELIRCVAVPADQVPVGEGDRDKDADIIIVWLPVDVTDPDAE
jgi:hypothetical protein